MNELEKRRQAITSCMCPDVSMEEIETNSERFKISHVRDVKWSEERLPSDGIAPVGYRLNID